MKTMSAYDIAKPCVFCYNMNRII